MTVTLTAAQWRVASCIGRRMSYADAAVELECGVSTVRAHAYAIFKKISDAHLNPHGLPQKAAVSVWFDSNQRVA